MDNIKPRNFKKISITPDSLKKRISNIKRMSQGKTPYRCERFNTFVDNMADLGFHTSEIDGKPCAYCQKKDLDKARKGAKFLCVIEYLGNDIYRISIS